MKKSSAVFELAALTFAGGAIGSIGRFLISENLDEFVWLILVNTLGTALLGFVQHFRKLSNPGWQAFLGTGVAGGFTTMSSLALFGVFNQSGGVLLLAVSLALGILAYYLGRSIALRGKNV